MPVQLCAVMVVVLGIRADMTYGHAIPQVNCTSWQALPIVASACKRKFHASARCFAAEEAAASAEAYASATSKACEDVDSTTAGENGRWSQPNAAGAAAAVGSLGAASAAGAATNGGSADGSDNRSTDSTEQSSRYLHGYAYHCLHAGSRVYFHSWRWLLVAIVTSTARNTCVIDKCTCISADATAKQFVGW